MSQKSFRPNYNPSVGIINLAFVGDQWTVPYFPLWEMPVSTTARLIDFHLMSMAYACIDFAFIIVESEEQAEYVRERTPDVVLKHKSIFTKDENDYCVVEVLTLPEKRKALGKNERNAVVSGMMSASSFFDAFYEKSFINKFYIEPFGVLYDHKKIWNLYRDRPDSPMGEYNFESLFIHYKNKSYASTRLPFALRGKEDLPKIRYYLEDEDKTYALKQMHNTTINWMRNFFKKNPSASFKTDFVYDLTIAQNITKFYKSKFNKIKLPLEEYYMNYDLTLQRIEPYFLSRNPGRFYAKRKKNEEQYSADA